MPNTYFSFKQFTIHQDRCAQKVSTDACLFGAWVANRWKNKKEILDIGAGTGLLMLMVAQRSPAHITGIEIEPDCFSQLCDNLTAAPWSSRLSPIPGDVREHPFPICYDGIISNPPFFEHDLPSSEIKQQVAKHSTQLNLEQLLNMSKDNLTDEGELAILLPYGRRDSAIQMAKAHGLHTSASVRIRPSPQHEYHRIILVFQKAPIENNTETLLTIQEENNAYTPESLDLLKDYYLYL